MRDPQIGRIKDKLFSKFTWAKQWPGLAESLHDNETRDTYDRVARDVVAEFQDRAGMTAAGTAVAGVANFATQVRLGAWPPPPSDEPPRHACLTFRGCGGVVGQDYTSRVAQACSSVVEEHVIAYPASMGGIPVGSATDPNAPSGNESVDVAIEQAVRWLVEHPTRTFVIGGYSLGAIAASRVRAELEPGGRLEQYKPNYVCGFTFGNPSRAFGHTFYLGGIPYGHGISTFQLPQSCCTWDWCDEADADDLYTNVPLGQAGVICTDAYRAVMDTRVCDPVETARRLVPELLKLVEDAGIQIPVFGSAANLDANMLAPAVMTLLLQLLTGVFAGLGGGAGGDLTRPAAAVQAAILGLKFACDHPITRAHVTYESEDALPGQTHLDHAIQHVNDWARRVTVRL
ncbi:hypothetical protein BayCH28_23230 [Mycolicibacterium sp. CH28]|uniref:hypothetical protein n=1 Tax=Mycolicibacterium sp. CH28 TaxID=2512237 RepID=UPI001080405B|nr:hypothetical protein [Mycolicibacterium sp. CH28]TGD84843.1 hypothetical protein BayCH28_23230 [Mycolicibacterium sp. CH28]